jgi:hypothetical protein
VCASQNEAEAAFCGTCGAPLATAEVARASGEEAAAPSPAPPATPNDDTVVPGRPSGRESTAATSAGKGATSESADPELPRPPLKPVTPEPPGITCPTCGTRNDPSRAFCKKCATELHPTAPRRESVVNGGFIARFLVSFLVSVGIVAGGATLLLRPASASPGPTAAPVAVVDDSTGAELELGLVPADPVPLPPLPADSTIQLVSFKESAPTQAPDGEPRAPWWSNTVPRVPAVTQFDGGKLQGHNCTMASGAMLARLAFGIVTTGSQLRALQDDQEGSSSFGNLNQALKRGWGVTLRQGALTPLQFRALLYAGAGAIVSVNYGEIPVGVRLQESYTGGHVIYIDAFRPHGPDGRPEYYVMDPIGHTWEGYKGEWWPAEDVERAAIARYGKMATAWAFAGGVVPQFHKNLPFDAYPGASPGSSAAPETLAPGVDPMPTDDLPLPEDPSDGGQEPIGPKFPHVDFVDNVSVMDPGPSLPKCAIPLAPLACPKGVIGILDPNNLFAFPTAAPAPTGRLISTDLRLLYGDVIAPGTYQIIYESPPDADTNLWLWGSDGGKLAAATIESGLLKGELVSVATVTLDPAEDYSFYATAAGDGYRTTSTVGAIKVTP